VTLKDEYSIGFDVTLVQVPAMSLSRHDLMPERSGDHRCRHVLDDIVYQGMKEE
jgi:hypothetical protein